MTWSVIRKATEEDKEKLEARALAFAKRHEVIELSYDDSAPVYRPTRVEAAAIRVTVQLGNSWLWPHRGLGYEKRTMRIDGRTVNVEFKLRTLHGAYGGPPTSAWTVAT